jgi:carboxyl-terminal processing protease
MSERAKSTLAIFLLLLLAGSAFVAGFFTNDYVEQNLNGLPFGGQRADLGIFWEAYGKVEEDYLGELPTDTGLTYGAVRGVLSELGDPYTVFVEPVAREQEKQTLQGTFGGIGAYLRRPEDGGPILLEPIPGNPAEIAGIEINDVLLAVDGVVVTPDMTVAEVAELIKGEKGTIVVLTVQHPGENGPTDIEIERADILIPSVSHRLLEDEETGYIRLSRFSGESINELEGAILDLQSQDVRRLILDLRDNPGGLLNAAVDVSNLFLAEGPILYQVRKGDDEQVFEAESETLFPELPLVLLINGGSASASEIVAGALQDRGRATLIGQRSFGKGSVQLVHELSDGSSVHVTHARWYTPDRQPIDQHGIVPDIPVEISQESIENGRDDVLSRAIEFLQSESTS